MIDFHAVMIDETGCEFGVSFRAETRAAAYEYLQENYPESRCDQLEDPQQTADREQEIYRRSMAALDGWDGWDNEEDLEDLEDDWDDYTDDERAERNQRRAEAEEAAQDGMYM